MTRPSIAVEADPTPPPTSAERSTSPQSSSVPTANLQELIERFAHCRSIDELPLELRGNPFIEHIISMTPDEQAHEAAAALACREANELYGDDPEQILAAINAGTHPLQRSPRARG